MVGGGEGNLGSFVEIRGCRLPTADCVSGFGFRVSGSGLRVSGYEFRVSGFEF